MMYKNLPAIRGEAPPLPSEYLLPVLYEYWLAFVRAGRA
jgi:hypothetical protein